MERLRDASSSQNGPQSRCASCEQPGSEARCAHCGAALRAGGFHILRRLHQGPHGRMYLAQDADGRRVALKEILFALVPDVKQLEAFEREAAFLRQLRHPCIPRFVASFQEGTGVGTRLYLAQEFIEGIPLHALSARPLPEAELVEVARQVLQILIYLHGLSPPVLHRDIKPANLLRRPDGQLVLVDFGSARDRVLGEKHLSTLLGTFGYMPPEQLGGTADETSDLYALGATLVHLASGRPPEEMFRRGLELDFGEQVSLSPRTEAFLRKLVAPRPEDRFRSARQALEALSSTAPLQHTAASRRQRWPRLRWLVLGGLGLGLLVSGGLALQPEAPGQPQAPVMPMPVGVLSDIQRGAPEAPLPPSDAMDRLRACPSAKALLGEDIVPVCGADACQGRYRDGDRDKASWSLPVRGSRKQGTYFLIGRREEGAWRGVEARLFVEGEASVEVYPCQPR